VPLTYLPARSYCVREAEANVNKQQQLVLPTAYNGECEPRPSHPLPSSLNASSPRAVRDCAEVPATRCGAIIHTLRKIIHPLNRNPSTLSAITHTP
jgi:hypothetical protein